MSSLGFGVIGAGVVGTMRARTVLANSRTRLLAVAEVDSARAARVKRDLGIETLSDFRQLLSNPGIDAVIVSSPLPLHEEMVTAALDAGKHVLCEKPLAGTVDACRRMVETAERAGRLLAVGFNHRYFPSFRDLRRVIADGRLGRLDHLRVFGGHPGLGEFRADWMYRAPLSGGGAMMDIGIHTTDLVRFLIGEIATVYGIASGRVWRVEGTEDNALVLMRGVEGASVVYQSTWNEWRGYRLSIEAYGEEGMARAQYAPSYMLLVPRDRRRTAWRRSLDLYPALNLRERLRGWQTTAQAAFAAELDDLLLRLEGRSVQLADAVAGLRAVEIAHAVYESSRTGREVRLPDSRPDSQG